MSPTQNFQMTLNELTEYIRLPIQNNRDIAGIIQAFEFTFEQSWKSIQKIANSDGVALGSPKAAYSYAMQNNWIDLKEESKWLQLLKDRNLTSHTYQENLAHEVLQRIQIDYLNMFQHLLKHLNNKTSS